MGTLAIVEPRAVNKWTARLRDIGRKLFSFHLLSFSVLALLAVLIAQPLRSPSRLFDDPDIWWHLANARSLFATHHFVVTEPYAFTVAGKRWIDPEWGAEAPFWMAYQLFRLRGIYFASWILIVANLGLLYVRSLRKTVNPNASLWASVVALGLMTVNAGPRTILCGYLCLSVLLWVIDEVGQGSLRWLPVVPFLFLVWVNLHGSWIIGLAMLALYIICGLFNVQHGLINQIRQEWRIQKALLVTLALSCAAVFVNPYGWRLAWNPFDMMLKQPLNIATIEEWKPLDLHLFAGKMMVAAIAIILSATLLKKRDWKLTELVFLGFAGYAAFSHVRFTVLAAVIITPWIAESLGTIIWKEPQSEAHPVLNALFAVTFLVMAVLSVPSETALVNALNIRYPEAAIQELQPGWKCLTQYDIGGKLAFEGKPDFMDSRVDTFEHHGVFQDYLDIARIKRPLELLDRYKIDHVLFQEQSPLVYLLERTPGWKVTLREGTYVLLARR